MSKSIEFLATSLNDLRAFPLKARREAGYQLDRLQQGLEPNDWKAMPAVGAGVAEIRIHDGDGAFRIMYVARFAHAICVLHCFQKKSQKTRKMDLDLAAARYRSLVKELKNA